MHKQPHLQDIAAYTAMINMYCHTKRLQNAELLYAELKEKGLTPPLPLDCRMLSMYSSVSTPTYTLTQNTHTDMYMHAYTYEREYSLSLSLSLTPTPLS